MEEKLTYQFTSNAKFLRQYHRLRKIIYDIDLGIKIHELSDHYDDISETLIVRNKDKCIGGCRITVSTPRSKTILPTESDDFRLKDLLPDLNLENRTYAEFSKLILLPEYRDNKVTEQMYKQLNRKARQLGARYIFVIANMRHARLYIRSYRRLGYKVKILNEITIPDSIKNKYNNVAQCIIMLDLAPKHTSLTINNTENVAELNTI